MEEEEAQEVEEEHAAEAEAEAETLHHQMGRQAQERDWEEKALMAATTMHGESVQHPELFVMIEHSPWACSQSSDTTHAPEATVVAHDAAIVDTNDLFESAAGSPFIVLDKVGDSEDDKDANQSPLQEVG